MTHVCHVTRYDTGGLLDFLSFCFILSLSQSIKRLRANTKHTSLIVSSSFLLYVFRHTSNALKYRIYFNNFLYITFFTILYYRINSKRIFVAGQLNFMARSSFLVFTKRKKVSTTTLFYLAIPFDL